MISMVTGVTGVTGVTRVTRVTDRVLLCYFYKFLTVTGPVY
jgi:hypothetical protein